MELLSSMPSFNFVLVTIIGCTLVTWLSRVVPFILLKKFQLSKLANEYLSFVPIVIMATLWFTSLFHQNIGNLPSINWENLIATVPTVLAAIISKNLLIIVIISLAIIRTIKKGLTNVRSFFDYFINLLLRFMPVVVFYNNGETF